MPANRPRLTVVLGDGGDGRVTIPLDIVVDRGAMHVTSTGDFASFWPANTTTGLVDWTFVKRGPFASRLHDVSQTRPPAQHGESTSEGNANAITASRHS